MKESTKTFLAGVTVIALCALCLILGGEVGKQTERQRWRQMDAETRAQMAVEFHKAIRRGREARDAEIAACSLSEARADRCYIPCATDADCIEKNGISDH